MNGMTCHPGLKAVTRHRTPKGGGQGQATPVFAWRPEIHGLSAGQIPVTLVPMTTVALTAHFDGEKVQFDEPCQIAAHARLVVVVLPPEDERPAWSKLSAAGLAKAYGESEPEYTAADLRS